MECEVYGRNLRNSLSRFAGSSTVTYSTFLPQCMFSYIQSFYLSLLACLPLYALILWLGFRVILNTSLQAPNKGSLQKPVVRKLVCRKPLNLES